MTTFDEALVELDARFDWLTASANVPGVAWGVLRDGVLVHERGLGTARVGEDRRPDADTVFRIASMTKSFTASAVLLLRDEGRLRLDDPVGDHVPELRNWRSPVADAGPVTIRQLLAMEAGLATDDPWGDRQQGLPLDDFAALLAAGPSFAWPPGTTFEYSNLGYGILGRVITNVARAEYKDVVRDRLLRPLGMSSTAYLAADLPEARLAHGYVLRDGVHHREGLDAPTDQYGALASMGGVFSTVRDLSRWVAGFLDAFPARSDPEGAPGDHPLRRASRREMQQVQRAIPPEVRAHGLDQAPGALAEGYGFGLMVILDPDLGTIIGHAGGYPGFGSYMTWHLASGLGVVGLGNLRYAPVRPVVADALMGLLRADVAPRRRVTRAPATGRLAADAERLVLAWDDALADRLFAMNVDLDVPRDVRRADVAKAVSAVGAPFQPDSARDPSPASPAERVWWLRGERGWLRLTILVTPTAEPRIQTLEVVAVPDPSSELRAAAAAALSGPSPWLGAMTLRLPTAGDGTTTATWDVAGERGSATLRVTFDAATGAASSVLAVAARMADGEGW
jgi:CubicO group peptidase (beta-lactamase class C family)